MSLAKIAEVAREREVDLIDHLGAATCSTRRSRR